MFWILTFHYLLLGEFRGLSSITFLNPELNVETKIFTESLFHSLELLNFPIRSSIGLYKQAGGMKQRGRR